MTRRRVRVSSGMFHLFQQEPHARHRSATRSTPRHCIGGGRRPGLAPVPPAIHMSSDQGGQVTIRVNNGRAPAGWAPIFYQGGGVRVLFFAVWLVFAPCLPNHNPPVRFCSAQNIPPPLFSGTSDDAQKGRKQTAP